MFGPIVGIVRENYAKILRERVFDPTVDSWFMMGSPWPILIIIACYLYFVLKLGPQYMENKKAFNLKYVLIAYNLAQVVYNALMCSVFFSSKNVIYYMWNHSCEPLNPHKNPLTSTLYQVSWYYMFSKFIDLLDTVFFVLRKKQSQVTLLHVYHHTNMALSTWAYLKYLKGEQGALIGLLNSAVHVVMYGYYLLSALGPQVQKYLWWKKYITKIQLGQFVIIMTYLLGLLVYDCKLPKALTVYMFANCSIFLVLFSDFYHKAYLKSAKRAAESATLTVLPVLPMEGKKIQ
ncbi:very long chain fatty acid elongase AAEL008004 isoform X1 [Bemisia tabaci]|uniref:very long chain fatty acid elongase AAEL008004 isoform X1 n=1 Tax=Bemisia tabaci TaxID=7038 RepID=UPI003B27E951